MVTPWVEARPVPALELSGDRERKVLLGLLKVGSRLHQSGSLDEMLQCIAESLSAASGFDAVAVYLLDRSTTTLTARAVVGVSPDDRRRMRGAPIPLEGYLPLMREEMRISRSFLFDHRRHQLPDECLLNDALSVPDLPPDWQDGDWHPLDSLTIPLEDGHGLLHGLLSLDRPKDRKQPDEPTIMALELFADQCVAAISRTRLYDQLQQLALTDSLTGLHNRQALDDALERELRRNLRSGKRCSVLFLDLDHFKAINDALGHAAGDQLLQRMAAALRQRLRRGDLASRYGGEEFVVLLPETEPAQAFRVAEALRVAIARIAAGECLSVSVGVASSFPGEADGAAVIARADAAMYCAKRRGRNRVEPSEPLEESVARP